MEITEDVPLGETAHRRAVIDEIRPRGIHVVIDDFGSGYANVDGLAELEPSVVKNDRKLVSGVHTSRRRLRVLESAVRLCVDQAAHVEGHTVRGRAAT